MIDEDSQPGPEYSESFEADEPESNEPEAEGAEEEDDQYYDQPDAPVEDDAADFSQPDQAPYQPDSAQLRQQQQAPGREASYAWPPPPSMSPALYEQANSLLGEEGAQVVWALAQQVVQQSVHSMGMANAALAADAARYPDWHREYGPQLARMLSALPETARQSPKSVEDARILIMRMEAEGEDFHNVMKRHDALMDGKRKRERAPEPPPRPMPREERQPGPGAPVSRSAPMERPATTRRPQAGGTGVIADLMDMYGVSREEAERAYRTRR